MVVESRRILKKNRWRYLIPENMTATLTFENSGQKKSTYTINSTAADTLEFGINGSEKVSLHNKTLLANDTVEFQVSALDNPSDDSDWQTLKSPTGQNPFDAPNSINTLTAFVQTFKKMRMKRTGAVDVSQDFTIGFYKA